MSNNPHNPSDFGDDDIDVDQIIDNACEGIDTDELENSFGNFTKEAKEAFEDAVHKEKMRDVKINTALALATVAVVGVLGLCFKK